MRQPSGFSAAIAFSTIASSRVVELPALLRGEGAGRVGHQRALLRAHLAHDLEQALVGIALDVQLAARPPRPHQFGQRRHVAAADVPLVGTRMHGQPVGPGIVRDAREAQHVGHPGVPRVAQQRDLVEVDAQSGHGLPLFRAPARLHATIEAGAPRQGAWRRAFGGSPSALGSIPRLAPFATARMLTTEGQAMDDRIVKSPQEASQGQKPGVTRYVLTIGLVLVVILFVVAYLIVGLIGRKSMTLLRCGLAIVLAMSATACGVGAPQRASDIQNVNAISDDIAAVR